MRYEVRGYGTRQEIIDELTSGQGGHRSERKQAELSEAIEKLRAGDDSVRVGHILYEVTDE